MKLSNKDFKAANFKMLNEQPWTFLKQIKNKIYNYKNIEDIKKYQKESY